MNLPRTQKDDPVITSFDAFKYLHLTNPVKGNALLLAFTLIGYWNHKNEDSCFPSRSTLMNKTGMKHKDTLRKAMDELILKGLFAVVMRENRSPLFYPMFVENAKTELLAKSQEEVHERLSGKHRTKVSDQTGLSTEINNEKDSKEEASTVSGYDFSAWVKDDADKTVVSNYKRAMETKSARPDLDLIPEGYPLVMVVENLESLGLQDFYSTPRCFVYGADDYYMEEVAGRWVKLWGDRYTKKQQISAIENMYMSLIGHDYSREHVTAVDTAMHILGSSGFPPSAKAVNAVRFATNADDNMLKMQQQYHETVRARAVCRQRLDMGHYDVPSAREAA